MSADRPSDGAAEEASRSASRLIEAGARFMVTGASAAGDWSRDLAEERIPPFVAGLAPQFLNAA